MNRTQRIKVLGLLSLPLLAIALAVVVFSMGQSADNAEAAQEGAAQEMVVTGGQTCPGAKPAGDICVPTGGAFTVTVVGTEVPFATGYDGVTTWLTFGNTGLTYKSTTTVWPDCAAANFGAGDGVTTIGKGCLTGLPDPGPPPVPPPSSTYKGDLFEFNFNCTTAESQGHVIELVMNGVQPAGTSGAAYAPSGGGSIIPVPGSTVTINCTVPNTPTPTATATNTPTATATNTPPPIPRMSKIPALQNVFLTRQGSKVPPLDCLSGTDFGTLTEQLSQAIESPNPKNPSQTQQLAAFEFEVHYDAKKVCVDLRAAAAWDPNSPIPDPLADPNTLQPPAENVVCIVEDSQSKPQLEGVARIGCVTVGKPLIGVSDLAALAIIEVYPQPEIYSPMKPNQDNGNVVQINNVNCDLGDDQGEAIPIFSCDDADITFRYLEGDVEPDCSVDAIDAQAISFRWGVEKGSLIYKDFMNLEPSNQRADNDIDINDLQFVFGRFGSTCDTPWPAQLPVNPKA